MLLPLSLSFGMDTMTAETKLQQQPSLPFSWQRQIIAGNPVERHGFRVIPQAEAISLRWRGGGSAAAPFLSGLVYNRPTGLVVEQSESSQYIPIVDVTRLIQVGLWALAFLFALLPWFYAPKHR